MRILLLLDCRGSSAWSFLLLMDFSNSQNLLTFLHSKLKLMSYNQCLIIDEFFIAKY
jgi:hypothetical protein